MSAMFMAIFWVVAGVLALSFFGISLEALISSPTTQANFLFLWHLLQQGAAWLSAYWQHLGS